MCFYVWARVCVCALLLLCWRKIFPGSNDRALQYMKYSPFHSYLYCFVYVVDVMWFGVFGVRGKWVVSVLCACSRLSRTGVQSPHVPVPGRHYLRDSCLRWYGLEVSHSRETVTRRLLQNSVNTHLLPARIVASLLTHTWYQVPGMYVSSLSSSGAGSYYYYYLFTTTIITTINSFPILYLTHPVDTKVTRRVKYKRGPNRWHRKESLWIC